MAYPTHGSEYHERQSWKVPCRAATTADITIATALNAGDTLDGVTLAAGDRVLVKDQAAPEENGIYVVAASPARAVDHGTSAEIVGSAVIVTEGTANAATGWLCETPAPITVGTTGIAFSALGTGGGGPPQVTGTGNGALEFDGADEDITLATADGYDVLYMNHDDGYVLLRAGLTGNKAELSLDEDGSYLNQPHTPGDKIDSGALWLVAGDDFVYVAISEKDDHTIQLYPGSGYGGLDVELADNDGGVFKHVTEAGDESIPSLGILRKLASAPGSPVLAESYYDTTLNKTRTWDGTTWQNHW